MGVHVTSSTIDDGLTPICNDCGVSLCWDISTEEYEENPAFWDSWICRVCNNGEALSLKKKNSETYESTAAV